MKFRHWDGVEYLIELLQPCEQKQRDVWMLEVDMLKAGDYKIWKDKTWQKYALDLNRRTVETHVQDLTCKTHLQGGVVSTTLNSLLESEPLFHCKCTTGKLNISSLLTLIYFNLTRETVQIHANYFGPESAILRKYISFEVINIKDGIEKLF